MVSFENTVSYSHSIVTAALSCTVSEIKREIGRKSLFFHMSRAFDAPVMQAAYDRNAGCITPV